MSEEIKGNNEVPFDELLVESEYNKDTFFRRNHPERYLAKLENNPDFVIRFKKLRDFDNDPEKAFGKIKQGKLLLEELNSKYQILVPVHFVIGKNEQGDIGLYTITDNVKKATFDDTELGKQEKKKYIFELENLFNNLIKYYSDKSNARKEFLVDIVDQGQYVYGKKKGDTINYLYMIDTDMHFRSDTVGRIIDQIKLLLIVIGEDEEILGVKFEEQKDNCKKLVDSLEENTAS